MELLLHHIWERSDTRGPGFPRKVAAAVPMGDRYGGRDDEFYDRGRDGGSGYGFRGNNPQHPPFPGNNFQRGNGNQIYGNCGQLQYQYNRNTQFVRKDLQDPRGTDLRNSSNNSSGRPGGSSDQVQKAGQDKQVGSGNQANNSAGAGSKAPQTGGASSGPPSDGVQNGINKKPAGNIENLFCNKCSKKGHLSKDCKEDIECANCGKGHMSSKCVWLKQKKPAATLVGFGGQGLACFITNHAKDNGGVEDKGKAVAIVKVKKTDAVVKAELLEKCLGKTYPWKWDWQAKEIAAGTFLVNFPSTTRINEVTIYDWVTLRGASIKINVK